MERTEEEKTLYLAVFRSVSKMTLYPLGLLSLSEVPEKLGPNFSTLQMEFVQHFSSSARRCRGTSTSSRRFGTRPRISSTPSQLPCQGESPLSANSRVHSWGFALSPCPVANCKHLFVLINVSFEKHKFKIINLN